MENFRKWRAKRDSEMNEIYYERNVMQKWKEKKFKI